MALIKRNTAYSVNDIVYTTFGVKLKCITAGTTSTDPLILDGTSPITDGTVTWEVQEENNVSIGTIISYMGNTVPERFLACDGTVYNIADYQSLANHINIEFGSYNFFGGDGTTTFAVPDLRGEFLRGIGTNSHTNQGSGANVGVHQNATEQNNFVLGGSTNGYLIQTIQDSQYRQVRNIDSNVVRSDHWVNINSSSNGSQASSSTEVYTSRPTNTSVLYCIKYR